MRPVGAVLFDMGNRARIAVWLGTGAVALGLVIGVAVLVRQPWRQMARFADGRVLTLAGVTYGNYQLQVGEWWQKLFALFSAQNQAVRSVSLPHASRYGANPLVLWFAHDEAAYERHWRRLGRAATMALIQQGPLPCVTAVDEHGDQVVSCPGRWKVGETEIPEVDVVGPDRAWFKPRERVKLRGKHDGRRLTVIARDDRGRTFAGYDTNNSGRQQLRREQCEFFLNLPPNSRMLDLTFALQRSRYVEFLANPMLP